MRFYYTVWVDTDTQDHADQVVAERLDCDEWYGFDYTVDYRAAESTNAWAVFDAVTGRRVSDVYVTQILTSEICRALTMVRNDGGRYSVRQLIEGKWQRT